MTRFLLVQSNHCHPHTMQLDPNFVDYLSSLAEPIKTAHFENYHQKLEESMLVWPYFKTTEDITTKRIWNNNFEFMVKNVKCDIVFNIQMYAGLAHNIPSSIYKCEISGPFATIELQDETLQKLIDKIKTDTVTTLDRSGKTILMLRDVFDKQHEQIKMCKIGSSLFAD